MRISDWSSDVCSSDLDQAVMRARHQRRDTPLAEKAQQLVQLNDEELLAGHRIEITIEAVNHHDRHMFLVDRLAYEDRKSVVSGKSVSVRVDLGGRRIIKNKKKQKHNHDYNTRS